MLSLETDLCLLEYRAWIGGSGSVILQLLCVVAGLRRTSHVNVKIIVFRDVKQCS